MVSAKRQSSQTFNWRSIQKAVTSILFFLTQVIIEEIAVYKTRLRELILKGESLSNSSTIPSEDKGVLQDSKTLEARIDKVENDAKDEDKKYVSRAWFLI